MGLWDKLKGELIDIVQWTDDSRDTMVHRFERYDNEIKNGAKLVVREGQAAVFVNMGQAADVFTPGMYTLETKNLPILSTIMGWKHGFHSPFKCEIYFVSTRRFTDLKWGTKNPVRFNDPQYGPMQIRAFGTYTIRVGDPKLFIKEIVGTDGHFTKDEITNELRNIIVSQFGDAVGESRMSILEMAGNTNEFADAVEKIILPEYEEYGLELIKLRIENISAPPEIDELLNKRTGMNIVGESDYTRYQAATAMEKAAEQPGGMAGGGMGMGMGFAMAQQIGNSMNQPQPQQQPAGGPPPIPQVSPIYVAIGGKQTGPFDANALAQQVAAGQLTAATMVWRQGMAAWTRAGEVADVASLLNTMPPPLPPVPPTG